MNGRNKGKREENNTQLNEVTLLLRYRGWRIQGHSTELKMFGR